jgi:hypothetical protein
VKNFQSPSVEKYKYAILCGFIYSLALGTVPIWGRNTGLFKGLKAVRTPF